MFNDTVSDFVSRLKNASKANKDVFEARFSGMVQSLAQVLKQNDFITEVKKQDRNLIIKLNTSKPINNVKRISKSGVRFYVKNDRIPYPKSKLGLIVLSTPKGILTSFQAKKQKVGGELIFEIW